MLSESVREPVQAGDRRLETGGKATENHLEPSAYSRRSRSPRASASLRKRASTRVRLTLASHQVDWIVMYRIAKEIEFCYGHRLLDYDGPCAHPHGHNGLVEIEMESEALDRRGMVYDFGDVKRAVKLWIDDNLDHRMVLRGDDPLVRYLEASGEPFYRMTENPTAENLARLVYEKSREMGFPVSAVVFWETPTSRARYSGMPR